MPAAENLTLMWIKCEGELACSPAAALVADCDCLIYVNAIARSAEQALMMPGRCFDPGTITAAELRARADRTGDAERARKLLILAEELEKRTSATPSAKSGVSKLVEAGTFPMSGRYPASSEALAERFQESAINAPIAERKRAG